MIFVNFFFLRQAESCGMEDSTILYPKECISLKACCDDNAYSIRTHDLKLSLEKLSF